MSRTASITVAVDPRLKARLRRVADAERRSLGAVVRMLLERGLTKEASRAR